MAFHFQSTAWCTVLLLGVASAVAAPLHEGLISGVVHDVRVTESGKEPVRLSGDAAVQSGTVQTGADSRAQVSFADQSVVRLGDNTALTIDSKSRKYELASGAILTQV